MRQSLARVAAAAIATTALTGCGGDRGAGPGDARVESPGARSATALAVRYDGPPRLLRLSIPSFKPVSRSVQVGGAATIAALSPDRSAIALGGGSAPYLRFVDLKAMKRVARLDVRGAGFVSAIAWPRRDRILALIQGEPSRVAVIDPEARTVLRVRALGGSVSAFHKLANRLVFLLAPAHGIGPARLAVVDAEGEIGSAPLPGVRAGGERYDDGTETPAFREIRPGLALDRKGRRAFVVPPGNRVLEIDLATLRVEEHALSQPISLLGRLRDWLEPAAQAKSIEGPTRFAAWYGGDLVVSAVDYHGLRDNRVHVTNHGVRLVDTDDLSVRTLDKDAGSFAVVAGRLLLYGGAYGSRTGVGLDGHDRAGKRVFALFGDRHIGYVQSAGRYAIVSEENSTLHRVVDVPTGRVVKTARTKGPTTILSNA